VVAKLTPVRIGLISFFDGRKRVRKSLKSGILAHQERIRKILREDCFEVVTSKDVVWTPRTAVQQTKAMLASDIAAILRPPLFPVLT
jgi:hypothetical protein